MINKFCSCGHRLLPSLVRSFRSVRLIVWSSLYVNQQKMQCLNNYVKRHAISNGCLWTGQNYRSFPDSPRWHFENFHTKQFENTTSLLNSKCSDKFSLTYPLPIIICTNVNHHELYYHRITVNSPTDQLADANSPTFKIE